MSTYPKLNDYVDVSGDCAISTNSLVTNQSKSISNSVPPPLTEAQLSSFYFNTDLQDVDDFIDEFIQTTLDIPTNDDFFRIVADYCEACRREEQSSAEISTLTSKFETLQPTVWEHGNRTVVQKGKCGDNKPATGSCSVPWSTFNQKSFDKLKSASNALNEVRFDKSASTLLETSFAKLLCQSQIQKCIHQFLMVHNISPAHPAYVSFVKNPNSVKSHERVHIRHYLSVLCHFLRDPSLPQVFLKDSQSWVTNLVAALVRFAEPEDQIFILCHLLRCPPGCSSWTRNFVQPISQNSQLDDFTTSVNHFLVMLNVLLSPVRKREKYLKSFIQGDVDNSWAVVDVDGDTESQMVAIPESDLLSFLGQFRFNEMLLYFFEGVMKSGLTESRVLMSFSFELTVLKVLYEGLRTYNCLQYRQICKHLGLMMRKSVQCVSDFWQSCRSLLGDACSRLQTEFDRLVFRAVFYLSSSKRLGVWQFLTDLPFGAISSEFIFRIVYLLLNGDSVSVNDVLDMPLDEAMQVLRDPKKLEQRLLGIDENDGVYLMTTLSNMACEIKDENLFKPLVVQIFNASFVNEATRDSFHKTGRQLLANISMVDADVVRLCFDLVELNINEIGGFALELMAALPLDEFRIDVQRWAIVKRWLDSPCQSLLNALAQQVLLALNWKFESDEGFLFLDYNLHKDAAVCVSRGHSMHCRIQANMIGGSIKQKITSSISGTINFEQQFDAFCWDLLLRLKLNPSDFNATVAQSITETNFLCDNFDLTSAYVAFQLNCVRSDRVEDLLVHLERLIDNNQIKAAICCVCAAVPLLADDGLLSLDSRWLSCINKLIRSDDTYLQYAKSLIVNCEPGDNLKMLNSMLSFTLNRLIGISAAKAEKFLRFWLISLCNGDLKGWNCNRSILYLMDSLIRSSMLFDLTLESVTKVLASVYEQMLTAAGKQTKGFFQKLFGDEPLPTFFDRTQWSTAPWVAFVAIRVEENCYADLFDALNLELLRHPNSTLELAFKKICTKRGLAFPINRLPVYQWMNMCGTLSTNVHPLLPLALQQFFVYLFRLVKVADPSLPGAVFASYFESAGPEKFTDLRNKFSGAVDFLNANSSKGVSFDRNMLELLLAASSWLTEKRFFNTSRDLVSLNVPMKYLLESVFHGDKTFWLDFLKLEQIRTQLSKDSSLYIRLRHFESSKSPKRAPASQKKENSLDQLFHRLKTDPQEVEIAPPVVLSPADLFPTPDSTILCDYRKLESVIEPRLSFLINSAVSFEKMKDESKKLNREFFSIIRELYEEIDTQDSIALRCSAVCENPNRTKVNVKAKRLNEFQNVKLHKNRTHWKECADKVLFLVTKDVPSHSVAIISVVKGIVSTFVQYSPDTDVYKWLKINGEQLFFRYVSQLNQLALNFPATRITLVQCIDILGQNFVIGDPNQVDAMFNVLMANQDLCGLLLPYFSPVCAEISICHRIYSNLVGTKIDKTIWRSLLQKFEILTILEKCSKAQLLDFFKSTLTGCQNAYTLGFDEVFTIYKQNLSNIFFYNYPQNFVAYVELLLNECPSKKTAPILLSDVVEKIGGFESKGQYVLLPYVAFELASMLQQVFAPLKVSCKNCGMTGLFHCWKSHAASVARFCRLTFTATVQPLEMPVSIVTCEESLKKSFDLLISVFDFWISCYSSSGHVYAPFVLDDAQLASSTIFDAFGFCLLRLQQTYEKALPQNSNNVFHLTWTFYAEKLVNGNMMERYVYDVYHAHLLKLSWQSFWPNLSDLHSMLQSFDRMPPACHSFVTCLVVRVPWMNVAQLYDERQPITATASFYGMLLEIFVKCVSREENYASCKASLPQLLNKMCTARWNVVEETRLRSVMQIVVRSLGADSIFAPEDDIRRCILKLLEYVTLFLPVSSVAMNEEQRASRVEKRRLFLDLLVQCLIEYAETKSASSEFAARYVGDMLDRLELLISQNVNQEWLREEAKVLLDEFISFFNEVRSAAISDATQAALMSWTEANASATILLPLLTSCGRKLKSFPLILKLQEKILSSYFTKVNPSPSWTEASRFLYIQDNFLPNYVQECRRETYLLTLYAYFMHKLPKSSELSDETLVVRDVISVLDLLKDKVMPEAQVVLHCGLVVDLLCRQIQFGAHAESVLILLTSFVEALQASTVEKGGFLGAIGITKRVAYTARFKVFAQLLTAFLQQQILAEREIRMAPDAAVTNSKIQYVKSLRTSKQYASYTGAVDLVSEFLTNTSKCFADALQFWSKLVVTLYNEKFLIDKCQL